MTASNAHMRATAKYEKNSYDKILLRVRKDGEITRETIQEAAQNSGESVNGFILDAIERKINELKTQQPEQTQNKPANFPKTIEEVEEAIKAEKDPYLMTDEEWNTIPDYILALKDPEERMHALSLLAAKRRRPPKK